MERMYYRFDGSFVGLLSCIFRAFQFKELNIKLMHEQIMNQDCLFQQGIDVTSHEAHAQRVWLALQQRLSTAAIRHIYFAFLSESLDAHQHILDYCIYVFQHQSSVEYNYNHPSVLAVAQWSKKVGREKHRMEAFIRFKKAKDGLFISLIRPDFDVLVLVQRHFTQRYQDQRWLIYDEKRNYGVYYDLKHVQHVRLDVDAFDSSLSQGTSQQFSIELDDSEWLYDQLWKDYFKSINIEARKNIKLHVQHVPKRYWRYLNEKLI